MSRPFGRLLLQRLSSSLLPRCRFPNGVVRCAVSGGADSTALLLLAVATNADVEVIHVDHRLRATSGDDARHVGALARRLGLPFRCVEIELAPGANLEARARAARYDVLPADVCTGHTADDVAETVLLNLMRGAGLDGLAPMVGRRDGPHRPLLGLRHAETVALCRDLDVTVIADEMNADHSFRRVRVRDEVLPLLNDVADRDVTPVLVRQAELLADEAMLLDELAATLDPTDAATLAATAPALARRAVRAWLIREGVGDGHPLDAAAVGRVLDVAAQRVPRADVARGWSVHRTGGRLRLVPPAVGGAPASTLPEP